MTGWWWLGIGTLVIIGWGIAVAHGGGALLPVDQWVLEGLARLRTPVLTKVMLAVAELGSAMVIVLGWATILCCSRSAGSGTWSCSWARPTSFRS
jgi:hypothetical protein